MKRSSTYWYWAVGLDNRHETRFVTAVRSPAPPGSETRHTFSKQQIRS